MRLGTARLPGEGLRLGTVRRLPRGVRKERYAADNWFDLWLPELAPSAGLLSFAMAEALTILATWLSQWRFAPVPGRKVRPSGMVTLRQEGGLPLMLSTR